MQRKLLLLAFLFSFQLPVFSQDLIHYWNFNQSGSLSELLTPSYTNGGGAITVINAPGGTSTVPFTGNTGEGFSDLNENARNGDAAGSHLRYTNSANGGTLIFSLPTSGYENVIVKYTTRRSSTGNGAEKQVVAYTTDGSNYITFATITTIFSGPALQSLDFSAIPEADNNPNFKIRITFEVGVGGTGGNNRFDNFTADATATGAPDTNPPIVSFVPANNTTNVAVNVQPKITFSENIRLINDGAIDNNNVDDLVELKLTNASGTTVAFDATISGNEITLVPSVDLISGQVYYVAVKENVVEDFSDNAVTAIQSSLFTTISPQTVFQPGDLVPIAYRMNATDKDDEVALLALVDILPGTIINFADGKFTTTGQCAGGLTWTAPSEGVAAGTIIYVKNDIPSVNIGSISGAKFGLSSGGDQFMVYTGSAASPSHHITALSSNAWLSTLAACSGSGSMLPSGLTEGTSAINLSTTQGNVSGNTVNAYYNGALTGNKAQLQASILNPANWIGIAGDLPGQTWPTWTFPGPPSVVSAKVMNQTTLRFVFNNDLDNASATDLANYTGIAGISAAVRTNNGALADTITVTFSTPFSTATSYSIQLNNIKDSENRTMTAPYTFNFSYNTSVGFVTKFLSVNENAGTATISLTLQNPSISSIDLVVKASPFSTANAADVTLITQTLSFTGASNSSQVITVPLINDNTEEQTEYLVLSLENPVGLTLTGTPYFTLFIQDNDREAPTATQSIELSHVGSFEPVSTNGSTTEIVVHDPQTQRLFMTSAIQDRLDIADFSNPEAISFISSVNMATYGGITSVAVKNGIVAVASPNANEELNGSVVFFDTDGNFLKQVTVGALPDMITFTPDGTKVLTANEGQPTANYSVDPEGSVSIIDISGGIASLSQSNVTTLDFTGFNANEAALIASGIRKTKSTSTLSQDIEPEYVTVSANSEKAWVTLQENNAIAEINLQTKAITDIWPLGTKNYNAVGNGFDASDNNGTVAICNWPVKGFYLPDGMANYSVGAVNYIVTANEGDEKEYTGFVERTTVNNASVILDPTVFPNAAVLKEDHNLGRFRITNLQGDTDNDGDYDELYAVGARSFSIFNADTKQLVYDSGDDFEMITSTDPLVSPIFNADNESNAFKNRSRAKGPEPEGLTVATIDGKVYAFIGLERVGGVMVYDITNPASPVFVDYKNSRSLLSYSGDQGPEAIIYISATNSPNGKPYVAVSNELSGTVSVYEVQNVITSVEDPTLSFNGLTLYPNPAKGETIRINKEVTGEVFDMTGTIVQRVVQSNEISIAGLTKGIYLFKTSEGLTRKFVVE
ncbi:MAG: large protein [Cytophagaceae bacterium]|jgi:hypothetical protein|nr:large protein [Cytophagaceae bacterium]